MVKMLKPHVLKELYTKMETIFRAKGIIAGKSGRHMKYPYTFSAKIAQFPIFFYLKNNWVWMYYPLGALLGLYIFSYIHELSNSESNIRNWQQTQMRNAQKEAHH